MAAGQAVMAAALQGAVARALGIGPGARVVIAGQPRAGAPPPPGDTTEVHHPKELLLALARAALLADGTAVSADNPHFMPIAEWGDGLAVLHGATLDMVCPVPEARNLLLLDGEDLLALAEERMAGDPDGLRHRRLALMDRTLAVGLPSPGGAIAPAPIDALLRAAESLPAAGGRAGGSRAAGPRPVRWLPCDFETGPYNYLALRRDPTPGSSQVAVQVEAAARGGAPVLVAFATAGTLGELGPALRAFRAAAETGGRASLLVFFFGTPEGFAATLAARPPALFFGDNFRCPRIRFLFAPFDAAEVLAAIGRAAGTIDSAYGGVLDGLARGLGLRHRLVLGPEGRFDQAGGEGGPHAIAWDALHAPATLVRRRHAAQRASERALVDALGAIG